VARYVGHCFGHIVRELRGLRLGGARVPDLLSFLERAVPDARDSAWPRYLGQAFSLGLRLHGSLFLEPMRLGPPSEEAVRLAESWIDENAPLWQAEETAELMRVRDYYTFLEVAVAHDLFVNVCAANPFAGAFIGRSGHRCYDGPSFAIARVRPPNRGLLAADPDDERLRAALRRSPRPMTYDTYLRALRAEGIRVLDASEGYVLEDGDGCRLHEPYRLHGIYERATGLSAWTPERGEGLRAELNRRLGHDLVQGGPHDDWESRNDPDVAGPRQGPQLPVIHFSADGSIRSFLTVARLARSCPPYSQHWSRLYPDVVP
jgi:hypothetical protein